MDCASPLLYGVDSSYINTQLPSLLVMMTFITWNLLSVGRISL